MAWTRIFSHWSIFSNSYLNLKGWMWKHELVQAIITLNIWMKFHRNPCENRVVRAMTRIFSHWSIFSNSILDLEGTMSKHKLVEANITLKHWMKFHRNPCENRVVEWWQGFVAIDLFLVTVTLTLKVECGNMNSFKLS